VDASTLRKSRALSPAQEIIDRQTDPWGIKVTFVEIKDVSLPEGMKRAKWAGCSLDPTARFRFRGAPTVLFTW